MKRFLKNNAGLSLLELMVAFAILGIVTTVILGFITSSTNAYGSVSAEISLQYQSQIFMGQLQEYVIDCNGGIAYDDTDCTLYVANLDGTDYKLYGFQLDAGRVYFGECGLDEEPVMDDLMAKDVTGFEVDFSPGGYNLADSVTIHIDMERNSRTFFADKTVALRNSPPCASSLDALRAKLSP